MLKSPPLLDKKVLVPRGKGQTASFSRLVEKYGGIPVEIPLIAFRPIQKNQRLSECFEKLDTYDWIIFTSNVTVETFFSFIEAGVRLPKIAVIGKKTAKVLNERGLPVAFVPTVYVAEVFVDEFLPYVGPGSRVLIPKGNLAREYIADSLNEAGAIVDEIVIYENFLPEESQVKLVGMLRDGELDILTFTSPSTVDHLMEVVSAAGLEPSLEKCIIGCIGPITEKRLREYGLPVHAAPEEYTVEAMINSTISYLERT